MNVFNIERTFLDKKRRGWDRVYFAIDAHDTIIPGTYTLNNDGKDFYPGAREVLQWLTKRRDIVLILWTSSHEKPVRELLKWFYKNEILFNYVNQNPSCLNSNLCDFSKKFYMNVILDDKAGFEGEKDWFAIKKELQRIGEWPSAKESFFSRFNLKKLLAR